MDESVIDALHYLEEQKPDTYVDLVQDFMQYTCRNCSVPDDGKAIVRVAQAFTCSGQMA